jgi:hypothetical protein
MQSHSPPLSTPEQQFATLPLSAMFLGMHAHVLLPLTNVEQQFAASALPAVPFGMHAHMPLEAT